MRNTTTSTHSIREFEGLRGWLAMVVVSGHWATTIPQSLAPLPQNLWAVDAVDVFIILSGFVITALLTRGGESYRQYITRRWFRLWPAFLVVLVLCSLLLPFTEQVLRDSLPAAMREERLQLVADAQQYLWPHLGSHLVLLHGLVPTDLNRFAPYAIVGQGWSISLEWQFYLLAPLFYAGLTRRKLAYTLIAVALAVALLLSGRYFSPAYLGNKLGFFGLGYLSYRVWQWRLNNPLRVSLMQARTILIVLIIAALALKPHVGLGVAAWLAVFGCTLLARSETARIEKRVNYFWLNPAAQFLGRISYSLYLVHFQMLIVALWVLRPASLATPNGGALFLLVTLTLSILTAALIYYTIERPGMRIGRMFSGRG